MSQVNSFRGGSTPTGSSISPDDIKPLKFYRNGTLDEEYYPLGPDVTTVELSDGAVKVTYDPSDPDSASKAHTDIVLALTEGSTPILVVGNRFYPMVYASSAGYVFQLLVDNTIKEYTFANGTATYTEHDLSNNQLEIIDFSRNDTTGLFDKISEAVAQGKKVLLAEDNGVLYLPDSPMTVVTGWYSFTACLYRSLYLTRTVDSFYVERIKVLSTDTIQPVPLSATTLVTAGLPNVPAEITGMYMSPFRANSKALYAQDGSPLGLLLDQSASSQGTGRGVFYPIGWYAENEADEKLAFYTVITRTDAGQDKVSPISINFNKVKRAGSSSGEKFNVTHLELSWIGEDSQTKNESFMLVPPNDNSYVADEPYVLTEKLVNGECELEWKMLSNLISHDGIEIIGLTATDTTPYNQVSQALSEGKLPIIRFGVDSTVYEQYQLAYVSYSRYVFVSSYDKSIKWLVITGSAFERQVFNLNNSSGDSSIYEAIYGTTTFEEISTALSSGYTVLCRKSDNYGNTYYGILAAFRNSGKYVFLSGDDNSQYRFELDADNSWTTRAIATPVAQGTHSRALTIHPADIDSSHTMENTGNANQWRGIGTILVPTGDVDLTNASCVISLDSGAGTSPTTFRIGLYEITDVSTGTSQLVAQSQAITSGLTTGLNRIPIAGVNGNTMLNGEGLYYIVLFTAGWGSITPFGKTTMNIGPLLTSWQYLWSFSDNEIPNSFSPVSSWSYAYPFFAMIEA